MASDAFSDLSFFSVLMRQGSLASAAQVLRVTPPSVSKRLAALEARLGVRLLQRTTRRMALTPEGETYLVEGTRVLAELDALERQVSGAQAVPRGLVRMAATLGFGRRHVGPALSKFARLCPEVEVQLHLTDRPVNLVELGIDLAVTFGEPPDSRITARFLAPNRRLLCAAPAYLRRAGVPTTPRSLAQHSCILLQENEENFSTWQFHNGARRETVKVRGMLTTNDGDCALTWALDGHGILLRSEWDAAPYLRSGRLRPVLPDWSLPRADIHLLTPGRAALPAKTRALVDFLLARFEAHRLPVSERTAW